MRIKNKKTAIGIFEMGKIMNNNIMSVNAEHYVAAKKKVYISPSPCLTIF